MISARTKNFFFPGTVCLFGPSFTRRKRSRHISDRLSHWHQSFIIQALISQTQSVTSNGTVKTKDYFSHQTLMSNNQTYHQILPAALHFTNTQIKQNLVGGEDDDFGQPARLRTLPFEPASFLINCNQFCVPFSQRWLFFSCGSKWIDDQREPGCWNPEAGPSNEREGLSDTCWSNQRTTAAPESQLSIRWVDQTQDCLNRRSEIVGGV